MIVAELVFAAAVVVPIIAGVLAHYGRWSLAGGPRCWGESVATRLGAVPGAIVVLVVGYAVTFAVCLGLGFVAKSLEGPLDRPVYHRVFGLVGDSEFTVLQNKLTLIGNNPIIQLVALFSVIILGCAYRRRWYIVLLGVVVAVEGEKYLQRALGHLVDRGHPPLAFPATGTTPVKTLGTYPSGGVARILAVYGAVLILVLLLAPRLSRAWRCGLWTGLVTTSFVEAFSRVYLSKHWFTDATFGLVFGALLMLCNAAAISALAYRGRAGGEPRRERFRAADRLPA